MDNRQEFYSRQVESLSAMILRLKRKGRTYVAMELVTFCLSVLAFVFFCLVLCATDSGGLSLC